MRRPRRRSWIHSFCSGSWMCMYSTPTVRAVRVAQHAEDVAQRHRLAVERRAEAADRELAVEIPDREAVVGHVELGVGRGARRPSGSRLAMRCPRTRYMLTSWWTCTTFSLSAASSSSELRSVPSGRLVRHAEAAEDVVVEAVVAEQQAWIAPQELAALRAGDDAVVVGAGERDDLADAEPGERVADRRPRTRPGSRSRRRRR